MTNHRKLWSRNWPNSGKHKERERQDSLRTDDQVASGRGQPGMAETVRAPRIRTKIKQKGKMVNEDQKW